MMNVIEEVDYENIEDRPLPNMDIDDFWGEDFDLPDCLDNYPILMIQRDVDGEISIKLR